MDSLFQISRRSIVNMLLENISILELHTLIANLPLPSTIKKDMILDTSIINERDSVHITSYSVTIDSRESWRSG